MDKKEDMKEEKMNETHIGGVRSDSDLEAYLFFIVRSWEIETNGF